MAPIKRRKVWNFSTDVFPPEESNVARKKRRFVHSRVRNVVVQRRRSLERRIERDVRDGVEVRSAAAWQQLRHIPPLSERECTERSVAINSLLVAKKISSTVLTTVLGKVESFNQMRYQEQLDDLIDSSPTLVNRLNYELSKSSKDVSLLSEEELQCEPTPDEENLMSSVKSGVDAEELPTEDDSPTLRWWNGMHDEIRFSEELEHNVQQFLVNAAMVPLSKAPNVPPPFPLPSIGTVGEEENAPQQRKRKMKKRQQRSHYVQNRPSRQLISTSCANQHSESSSATSLTYSPKIHPLYGSGATEFRYGTSPYNASLVVTPISPLLAQMRTSSLLIPDDGRMLSSSPLLPTLPPNTPPVVPSTPPTDPLLIPRDITMSSGTTFN